MRTLHTFILLLGFVFAGHGLNAATPQQAGDYAGTAKVTNFDLGNGNKLKSTSEIIITIQEDDTVSVQYGVGPPYVSSGCPISPKNGGFFNGTTSGYSFTILYEFKGKSNLKGTLQFISPYNASSGKFNLKKINI